MALRRQEHLVRMKKVVVVVQEWGRVRRRVGRRIPWRSQDTGTAGEEEVVVMVSVQRLPSLTQRRLVSLQ
jgi:hypothetical protein